MAGSHCGRFVSLCSLGLVLAGCSNPAAVYVESTIHPDGSCDRMIWQPKDQFLPAEAKKPEWKARWKEISDAGQPPDRKARKGPSGESKYFIARGSFQNPGEIPPHYRFADAQTPEAGASELERTYERIDYGFVVEHRWREKITNIVTLDGFLKGRDQLLDLILPPYIEAIEKVFSKDYDVSRLSAFLRTDFRRFLENASRLIFDAALHGKVVDKRNSLNPELFQKILDEAERRGLDPKLWIDSLSGPPNEQKQTRAVKLLLSSLVVRHFRHKDGSTLTSAEVEALIQAILVDHRYDKAVEAETKSISDRLEKDAEFKKRAGIAFLRITGLYGGLQFLFVGEPHYEFAIALPGELVETNGQGTQSGRTLWKFAASDLFPGGYEMKARSIFIDREAQKKVLGRIAIDDEAKASELMQLVGHEGGLLEAVRRLHKAGDRSAVREVKTTSYEEGLKAERLRKMLFAE